MSESLPAESSVPRGVWSREVVRAFKTADCMVVRFETPANKEKWENNGGDVTLEFHFREVKQKGRPYSPEHRLFFVFPGAIRAGHLDGFKMASDSFGGQYARVLDDETNLFNPTRGCWVHSYVSSRDGSSFAALESIPLGATVKWIVGLDFLTSSVMTERGLHGDSLDVDWTKGNARRCARIDTAITLHNSARFGASRVY